MNSKNTQTQMRSVPCKQGTLTYQLTRKSVKNVNLRIKPDGRILVSAGRRVSVAFIDDFVQRNQDYIYRALERFQKTREKMQAENSVEKCAPLRQYVDGEGMIVLGKRLTLKVVAAQGEASSAQTNSAQQQRTGWDAKESTARIQNAGQDAQESTAVEQGTAQRAAHGAAGEGVRVEGDSLILAVRDTERLARKEKLVNDWLNKLREDTFAQICMETYPVFAAYGIRYPQIKIRRMTSRWGSCQPTRGIITLNSRLIEASRESIEYVVLHEFAHFIHPNHSKDFYGFVEKLMPDWKERKGKLPNATAH